MLFNNWFSEPEGYLSRNSIIKRFLFLYVRYKYVLKNILIFLLCGLDISVFRSLQKLVIKISLTLLKKLILLFSLFMFLLIYRFMYCIFVKLVFKLLTYVSKFCTYAMYQSVCSHEQLFFEPKFVLSLTKQF